MPSLLELPPLEKSAFQAMETGEEDEGLSPFQLQKYNIPPA